MPDLPSEQVEKSVLEEERKSNDFVSWLRNEERTNWLCVSPYTMAGETKAICIRIF